MKEVNVKQSKMQFLAAIAAVAVGISSLQAEIVAWYHFNEGEEGYAPTGYPGIVTNAVAPGTLTGHPYRQTGTMAFGGTAGDYLPMYSAAFPSGMTWYDPVTGECDADGMGMYFHTANGDGSGHGAAVLVTDDDKLHCANITVECFAKIALAPGKTSLKNQTHLLTMRNADMASTPNQTKNIKAWGLFLNAAGRPGLLLQTPLPDGSGVDSDKSFASSLLAPNTIVDGNWHHIAFTYDGATACLYVDHQLANSKSWAHPIAYGTASKNRLCIGTCDAASYTSYWQGYIDEVRIIDEALPPEQFLQVRDVACDNAIDDDTALYLPFNNMDFTLYNSATSAAASKVSIRLSTNAAGIYPRVDDGSELLSASLHSGIFATDSIANIGCWTFTNNLQGAAYAGKARHIFIDDFSKNNGEHLISSGDFTAECWIKVPETPVNVPRILAENSGAKGLHTLDIRLDSTYLYCTLASQKAFLDYETNKTSKLNSVDITVPISKVVGGAWHHIALVVDRTHQVAKFYLDGNLVGMHTDFVLASSVSTVNEGHRLLKIGDGYGGNNPYGLLNMSIDEFRITRRALSTHEFLMAGAAAPVDLDSPSFVPTRAFIGFDGDLGVEPCEVAASAGLMPAGSSITNEVKGRGIVADGNGNIIHEENIYSMYFGGTSGQAVFDRNLLLERDMKSLTLEFFMKGTKDQAKAWAYFVRMFGNATAQSPAGERLFSIGYSDAAGHIYVVIDCNGRALPTFYVSNAGMSLADSKWHHIAVTFDPDGAGNTICKVYVDYKQLGDTHTFAGLLETGDHYHTCLGMGANYNGFIDEVRISKGVLTVDQMLHVTKNGTVISIR